MASTMIWASVESRFQAYPAPLDRVALDFLPELQRRLGGEVGAPLLDLGAWLGGDPEELTPINEACVLFYAAVRAIDDAVDEPAQSDPARLHAALLFMWDAQNLLATCIDSWFQSEARKAWQVGTACAERERQALQSSTPYAESDFLVHAGKCMALSVPLLWVLSRQGRQSEKGVVLALIQRLGEALGYINDLLGWKKDVKAGIKTLLVREMLHVGQGDDLRIVFYREGFFHRWIEKSILAFEMSCAHAISLSMPGYVRWVERRVLELRQLQVEGTLHALASALETTPIMLAGSEPGH